MIRLIVEHWSTSGVAVLGKKHGIRMRSANIAGCEAPGFAGTQMEKN
jgi:hypothetical protein